MLGFKKFDKLDNTYEIMMLPDMEQLYETANFTTLSHLMTRINNHIDT